MKEIVSCHTLVFGFFEEIQSRFDHAGVAREAVVRFDRPKVGGVQER